MIMAHPLKRKRIVLNMQQKLDIIDRLGKGESGSVLAKEYNVGRSSIASIKNSKDSLLSYISALECKDSMQNRKTMKNAVNQKLEEEIYGWYLERRTSGDPVSGPMICEKALELNNKIGGSSNFKASNGWLKNFKSRHGVRLFDCDIEKNISNSWNEVSDVALKMQLELLNGDVEELRNRGSVSQSPEHNQNFKDCQVVISSNLEDKEVKPDEFENSGPCHDEAFYAIDTALDWFGKQAECDVASLMNLIKLRDLAYRKAMSVAFSSNDADIVNRKIPQSSSLKQDSFFSVEDIFEIQRCVSWIEAKNFSKVALQFPDNLLGDAAQVALELEKQTNKQMFILGDTSYESCCVDEVAAEHVLAEGIIHFGHSCLSTTKRLPVLYVFGKQPIDVLDVGREFKRWFPDMKSCVVILYEVTYSFSIDNLLQSLSDYENVIVSQLHIPGQDSNCSDTSNVNSDVTILSKCGRRFHIPNTHSLDDYLMFYIGSQNQSLMNFMLSFNKNKFFSYDPRRKSSYQETLNVNQYLRKRYFYIEKAKDAKIVGILVGTLGVSDYLTIIKHLQDLIKEANKKAYTIVVGKLNSAKLANFPEIEIFVHVACPEASLVDCQDYYQPIITPYELEIACNQARKWTGDYVADFGELLPGAVNYVPSSKSEECEADVSLLTGKIRCAHLKVDTTDEDSSKSVIATREKMEISNIHSQAAGEFLASRIWQGLEQRLGETPVAEIKEGRKGIASQYEDEKELCDNKDG